ncbi:MAG: hypothetical protein V7676_11605 [Parasphingorhabdus sp.]|uniref:hypothetical protein n=1 Tax=Parasphingorhabdus sp. TaxID=2709688 RepID=UPI003002D843
MAHIETPTIREAVGVFQSEKNLQSAIDDLLSHGFDRSEISLLAPITAVEEKLGGQFKKVAELEDNSAVPTTAYIPVESIGDAEGAIIGSLIYLGAFAGLVPVIASGGTLAAAALAVALAGGGGGAIGTILAKIVGQHHAEYIADQLDHGGLLLWVRTWNDGDEKRAVRILSAHSGSDVHVHGLPENQEIFEDQFLGIVSDTEQRAYNGESYLRVSDSEYYAFGKVFPSELEVKSYIDRRIYLETLRSDAIKNGLDLNAALLDPEGVFETPDQLIATDLPKTMKSELLKRWAYEVKELEQATNEGMPVYEQTDQLRDIVLALTHLD